MVASPKKPKKNRRGISREEEAAIKHRLLKRCCSSAWIDAQFYSLYDVAPNGDDIVIRAHNPRVYPPPADTSPMARCRSCGVIVARSGIDAARMEAEGIDAFARNGHRLGFAQPICGRWACYVAGTGMVREYATRDEAMEWLRTLGAVRIVGAQSSICLDCHCGGNDLDNLADAESDPLVAALLRRAAGARIRAQDAFGASPWHTSMEAIRSRGARLHECRLK